MVEKKLLHSDGPYMAVTAWPIFDGGVYLVDASIKNIVYLSPKQVTTLIAWLLVRMLRMKVQGVFRKSK